MGARGEGEDEAEAEEEVIGTWAIRIEDWDGGSSIVGKAHFVESEIEDRVVTRCGRQLKRETERGNLVSDDWIDRVKCRTCKGREEK
jgi:hypothetical protein